MACEMYNNCPFVQSINGTKYFLDYRGRFCYDNKGEKCQYKLKAKEVECLEEEIGKKQEVIQGLTNSTSNKINELEKQLKTKTDLITNLLEVLPTESIQPCV